MITTSVTVGGFAAISDKLLSLEAIGRAMIPQRRISPPGTCAAGLYLRRSPATEPVMTRINVNGQAIEVDAHLDRVATRSCQTPISAVGRWAVTTIEGLSKDHSHPVQQAWIELDVPQCGEAIHRAAKLEGGPAA